MQNIWPRLSGVFCILSDVLASLVVIALPVEPGAVGILLLALVPAE